jgi:hypothetical protein
VNLINEGGVSYTSFFKQDESIKGIDEFATFNPPEGFEETISNIEAKIKTSNF